MLSLALLGCTEDDFAWELERSNKNDAQQNLGKNKCAYYNCESSDGFTFFINDTSSYIATPWDIKTGYLGSGLGAYASGGAVQFSLNLEKMANMSFWAQVLPSYQDREPKVFINERPINSSEISQTTSGWRRFQTSTIDSGFVTIRIEYPETAELSYIGIDEIEFFCD